MLNADRPIKARGEVLGRMTEVATVAGTAILVMLLAMWASRPDSSCVLTREPHRRLALERAVDSEHLARDVREIGRIALRYAAAHAARSSSVIPAHTEGDNPSSSALGDLIRPCEAGLERELMTTHDVTVDQMREAASRER
jgi:hypothetical protein